MESKILINFNSLTLIPMAHQKIIINKYSFLSKSV